MVDSFNANDPFAQHRKFGQNRYGESRLVNPTGYIEPGRAQEITEDPLTFFTAALGGLPQARLGAGGRHLNRLMQGYLNSPVSQGGNAMELLWRAMNPNGDISNAVDWTTGLLQSGFGQGASAAGGPVDDRGESAWFTPEEAREFITSLFTDRAGQFGHMEEDLYQAGADPRDLNALILAALGQTTSTRGVSMAADALDRKLQDFMTGSVLTGEDPSWADYLYGSGLLQQWGLIE